jgi:hypothetical protein
VPGELGAAEALGVRDGVEALGLGLGLGEAEGLRDGVGATETRGLGVGAGSAVSPPPEEHAAVSSRARPTSSLRSLFIRSPGVVRSARS